MARMLKTEVPNELNQDVESIQQELEHSNKMDTVAYLITMGAHQHWEYTDD